jgi:hypothetical protein
MLVLVPLFAQSLPEPTLTYQGSADNGLRFTHFNFAVANYRDFSDELFQAAPDLPPCGLNHSASRTWTEIFDNAGQRLYGFCAMKASVELQRLWFALPAGTRPPKWIRVRIEDRRTGRSVEGRLDIPDR